MSTLKVNTLEEATSGGATYFTVKAWINWKNSGGNSLEASGNVSSVTDVTTGVYRTNFSNAFSTATYTVSGAVNTSGSTAVAAVAFNTSSGGTGYTTTACGHASEDVDAGFIDYVNNTVIYLR